MPSVGNQEDGRRTSGLGLGYRPRGRMEDNELEEGEAISSLEYDAVVDPDVALSYIDEKIQVVLGHFQKVFEGEISAESSGAKLGEYGSFLPVYLRLPPWPPQTRVPGRATDRNTPTSSQNQQTVESKPVSRSSPVPPGNTSAPAARQSDDTKSTTICPSEEFTPHNKGNENNLLKLRIKVGPGNVLLRPLAAIYSDMGLDYSPSSSPEDSPGTSGGTDSPMAAFEIMTCFPVPDGYVLSPLPEGLLCLAEQKSRALDTSKREKILARKKSKNVKEMVISSNSKKQIPEQIRMSKTSLPDLSDDEPLEIGVDFVDLKGEQKVEEDRLNKQNTSCLHEDGAKRKSNGMQRDDPKESVGDLTYAESGKIMQSKGDNYPKKQNAVRSLKELSKSLSEGPHQDSLKDAKMACKADSMETDIYRERVNESDSQSTKKDNFLSLDTSAAPLHHVVIEDNWVCCDKCQQWRLLPYGMDPAQLPKKWLCVMLDWLPGMNKCSISEEETTRALHAAYQAPVADNQAASGSLIVNGKLVDLGQSQSGFQLAANCGKKKYSLAELPSHEARLSDPLKHQHAFMESISLGENQVNANGSIKYPLEHMGKSAEPALEKVKKKKKKKHRTVEQCSTEGGVSERNGKISKPKSKRSLDQDGHGVFKKVRSEEAFNTNEDWNSVHGKLTSITSMASKSLNFSSPKDAKIALHDSEGSMKKFKVHEKVSSRRDLKENSGASYAKKPDRKDYSMKKRKEKQLCDDNVSEKEEIRRSEPCKEKKAKTSKMEEMDAFKIRKDDETKQRDGGTKWPQKMVENTRRPITEVEQKDQFHPFAESENNLNYVASKRALSDVHLCTAATSSSSKVSGSSRNKSNFNEMRASPVESVSSSPLRASNAVGSDATLNAGSSLLESQKRRFNGEAFGGIDQQSNLPNTGKATSINHIGSLKDYPGSVLETVNTSKGKSVYKDNKSSPFSYGKAKDEFEKNKTATSDDVQHKHQFLNQEKQNIDNQKKPTASSLSRAKEKHKSSSSRTDKHKDKIISDSVGSSQRKNNFRHGSDLDLKDGRQRASEKNDARRAESSGRLASEGPRDSKLNNLQLPEDLRTSESDLQIGSSKTNKISQSDYFLKSPYEDQKASKLDLSSNTNKHLSDNNGSLARTDGDRGKLPEQPKNLSTQNGKYQNYSAASVLKEARDLKHTANRLKAEGSEQQSTALYFEAALKFLHVAFLLELSNSESGKQGESIAMYSDTAKLCEFCAHEYERSRDNAAAALAYKCMEVAFMKVVYSKHSAASKDRHELHAALHMMPSGESPSSSASDIDNLNNHSTIIKNASSKVVNPQQMVGTHVIAARNRSTYVRLLDFAHDVNYAMEASKKSQNAFSAANACREESNYSVEGLASVKGVLDLSFHDVEGLLRLVRQSMDSISR